MIKSLFLLLSTLLFISPLKGEEIVLWHAFDGPLEKIFLEIVENFNTQSENVKISALKKGDYKEVLEKGLAAFSKRECPHILQVYEVGTLSMIHNPEVFVAVDDLMHKYNKNFDPDIYIDVLKNFYSTADGKMLSFPWNASTGILFYNKEAFSKAGLDPESPPKTWEEFEVCGEKLVAAGFTGFTTAWPAAYHLEHVCNWHNLPFATLKNGFEGLGARLIFNGPEQIFHLSKLCEWADKKLFTYAGRFTEEPENLFTSGKSAILLQGANRLSILSQKASFSIGIGTMPYWAKMIKKPYTLNIGGASFWVLSGFDDAVYKSVVQFFEFLSSTSIQAYWHQKTGYLPITDAAYYLTKKKNFYLSNPAAETAVLEVMGNTPGEYSKGIRLGNYLTIRDQIIDHLENAFSGKESPKEALDRAVESGNLLLEQFEKDH